MIITTLSNQAAVLAHHSMACNKLRQFDRSVPMAMTLTLVYEFDQDTLNWRCSCIPKMNFLDQSFLQKSQAKQDKQTDTQTRTHVTDSITMLHLQAVIIVIKHLHGAA